MNKLVLERTYRSLSFISLKLSVIRLVLVVSEVTLLTDVTLVRLISGGLLSSIFTVHSKQDLTLLNDGVYYFKVIGTFLYGTTIPHTPLLLTTDVFGWSFRGLHYMTLPPSVKLVRSFYPEGFPRGKGSSRNQTGPILSEDTHEEFRREGVRLGG